MSLRLLPPDHAVPDNIWQTLLLTLFGAGFVWLGWQDGAAVLTNPDPVTAAESLLLQGAGHPAWRWVESLGLSEVPLRANRLLSLIGWLLSLAMAAHWLIRQSGWIGSLPSLLILLGLPGLSPYLLTAGSGSLSLFCFLRALSLLSGKETSAGWGRGGAWAAAAVMLQPLWLLPVLGLGAGLWEIFRPRLKAAGIGFAAGAVVLILLLLTGIPPVSPGPSPEREIFPAAGSLLAWLRRDFLLAGALVLMLVFGVGRRGLGWWSLAGAALLFVLHPLFSIPAPAAALPLTALTAIGLARLPALIDLRFPRAYQSVLLCQLLLWIPTALREPPSRTPFLSATALATSDDAAPTTHGD